MTVRNSLRSSPWSRHLIKLPGTGYYVFVPQIVSCAMSFTGWEAGKQEYRSVESREKTHQMCIKQGTVLDWIIISFFLPQPVTFALCLCALSLIEAQKGKKKRLNCRLNCTPRSFEHRKRYTTAMQLLPWALYILIVLSNAIIKSTDAVLIVSLCVLLSMFY